MAAEFFSAFRAPANNENDEVDEGYFSDDEDLVEGRAKLSNIVVTVEEVLEEMGEMHSESSGPTGITPYVTKKLGKAIAPYLTLYFNKMIKDEEVPEVNRINYVSPLLKPGKAPEDPANYRPVSLTEVWIRLFERVLKKHIAAHLEEVHFISSFHHGFVKENLRLQIY